tara:strand:- start:294 stop:1460 length:1167 start_codon:yes stop_codon:yes gene_type:complete
MPIFTRLNFRPQFVAILLWSISSQVLASEKSITCIDAINSAEELNAYDLWSGASDCSKSNLKRETNFLLIAGQIRAMSDMGVLEPVSDEEGVKAGDLYGALYYKSGGSGFDEIYRDAIEFGQLFRDLESWTAKLRKKYNPGWEYKANIDPTYYDQMTICQKKLRISKLKWYSSLVQNDEYYEMSTQLSKLQADNPGAFQVGTDAYKQYQRISSKINSVSSKISKPKVNPKECDFIKPFTPDPNASFKQIYKGYNGPNKSRASVFKSDTEIRDSWLGKAIKKSDLDALLVKIDFNKKIIVSLSVGKRKTATGTIHISDVKFNTVYKSLSVSGLVGVIEQPCTKNQLDSYPFALAIADIPPVDIDHPGISIQNFADGCKEVVSGKAVSDD